MRLSLRSLTATLVLALFVGACASVAVGVYRGPTSDHFDGRRFHNAERFNDAMIEDAIRRTASILAGNSRGGAKWVVAPTDTPPPRVGGGKLRVTFVNHATLLLQMDSLNILTDPIWSDRASPFQWAGPKRRSPPGIRFEDLPAIDIVLISHNHYDHMDLPTLRRLVAAFHPRIITGLGNAAYLTRNGIPGAQDIDWWQSVALGRGVRLTGVPAQHWSARWINDKWRTLWLGFVIESESGPVYFAGDTGFGAFLERIRDRFGPLRLAMLPISPARPRAVMAPRHMSAGDAVRAYELLNVSTAIGMHFGTFRQGGDDEQDPADSLALATREAWPCTIRFWALYNGAARDVPPLSSLADDPCREPASTTTLRPSATPRDDPGGSGRQPSQAPRLPFFCTRVTCTSSTSPGDRSPPQSVPAWPPAPGVRSCQSMRGSGRTRRSPSRGRRSSPRSTSSTRRVGRRELPRRLRRDSPSPRSRAG
jgi:L-ascorbate metabolism protein UlaG (beta-lactamase superfamily)